MTSIQTEASHRHHETSGPHFSVPTPVEPISTDGLNLRSLQSQIEKIANTVESRKEAISNYLQIASSLTNASDVAYNARANNNAPSFVTNVADLFRVPATRDQLTQWAAEACRTEEVQLNRLAERRETVATLPVIIDGKACEALSAALLVPGGEIEPFVVTLQLVATAIGSWHSRHAAKRHAAEAKHTAAIIELISRCQEAENLSEASIILVNEMQNIVGCESVAIALRKRGSDQLNVVALSGTHKVDQKSDVVRRLTDAAHEAIDRDDLTVWPPLGMNDRHTTRVHQQLVEGASHEAVVSHNLKTDDDVLGAWLFLGQRETLHQADVHNLLRAASPHIASTLAIRKQADAGPFVRLDRSLNGDTERRRRWQSIVVGTLVTAACMLIPIPYRITCDCTVEPTVRRFAAVPYNGVLRDSLVEPGDIVEANRVIARMDDRDLRLEKSEALKTREIAIRESGKFSAQQEIAEAQIARLRAQEMDARLEWIRHREEHLQIRSPIDGVVLKGDLEDVEGAPVQRGQTLFEIAPLDSLELKLAIPEGDITSTTTGMAVTARLDGAPGRKIEAELRRITPRATAESGTNVFLADATLAKRDEVLRPGMSGTAKVVGANRPIGWILFHRAYRKVVDFVDW